MDGIDGWAFKLFLKVSEDASDGKGHYEIHDTRNQKGLKISVISTRR
jgi:hypothetical protein